MYLTLKFEQGIEATALLWSFYNDKWKGKLRRKMAYQYQALLKTGIHTER